MPALLLLLSALAVPAPAPTTLAAPVAIARAEPFDQLHRAQDASLLDAPPADLARWLTPAERARFHAYRRPRWMRVIFDLALEASFFFALVGRGLGGRLYAGAARAQARLAKALERRPFLRARLAPAASALTRVWGDPDWPAALLFSIFLAALLSALSWPTSLVFDWLLPRRHGLSAQSLPRWLWLSLLQLLTYSFGLATLAFGLWGLLRRVRRTWLWLGVPAGVLVALAGLADPLTVRMRNQMVALAPGPARAAIAEVLERAGVSAEEIDRIDARRDTFALDAFVSGQGATRRIVLYDTLVDALTPRELAAVVAHELGHLRDADRVIRAALAGALVPLLLFLAMRILESAARAGKLGFSSARDVRALPVLLLAAFLAVNSTTPLANRFSRKRELRADLYALDLTRDPASLRSALLTLARKNQLDPAPPAAVWLLLYDHPPLAQRLGLIDAWEAAAAAGER